MKILFKALLVVFTLSSNVFAQSELPTAIEQLKAYAKGTRSKSGNPGENYWQNSSNYSLKINFNPNSRLLKGNMEVVYTNNSADTLNQVWFKLYPNLYKKGSIRKSKIAQKDLGEGVKINRLQTINGTSINFEIEGTNMIAQVPAILPGQKITFQIDYEYTSNKGSHVRTGQVDKGSHFIAYFFPRIAVYDDIDGWNKYPYTGGEEFYNDFDNFDVHITVPKKYTVWATGDLINADEVFNPTVAKRLAEAEKSDEIIDVINDKDLKNNDVTAKNNFNTFKYNALNVPDFVFALSDHYLWKSTSIVVDTTSGRRTRVDAAFNPIHKDYYEVVDFARKTVESMSFKFPKWPFPYNHITVFDGLDQMEYPMMVNDNPVENRKEAILLTNHEIMHTMFPFYMGTNETKHAWMDEGWATIGEWLIGPMVDSTIVNEYGIFPTARWSGTEADAPIVTLTPELKGTASFTNPYPKPALGYLFIKDYLGDELFFKAIHHYIQQWNGKHPTPNDFFYAMNMGSGEDLNWFWQRWLFENGVNDMAIKAVEKISDGYQISVLNKSNKPMPLYLNLYYTDGSVELKRETIGIWKSEANLVKVDIKTNKVLDKVILDHTHVPDKDKSDNTFKIK